MNKIEIRSYLKNKKWIWGREKVNEIVMNCLVRTPDEVLNYMKHSIKEIEVLELEANIFYMDIQSLELAGITWLPIEKEKKLNSYIYDEDKKRMLGGVMTYLYGMFSVLYNKNEKMFLENLEGLLRWNYNIYGKPFLENKVFFNISHSGNYALCAVSANEVGIDIEKINPDYIDIATMFFSEQEAREVMQCELSKRAVCFTEIWVRKESFAKTVGMGLNIDLSKFYFSPISNMLWKAVHSVNNYNYHIKDINIFDKEYRVAVCCKTKEGFIWKEEAGAI